MTFPGSPTRRGASSILAHLPLASCLSACRSSHARPVNAKTRIGWWFALAAAIPVFAAPAAAAPSPGDVAALLVRDDPPLGVTVRNEKGNESSFTRVVRASCVRQGPKWRCQGTWAGGSIFPERTVTVWVRLREASAVTVCASLRPVIPAGCWSTADGDRDLEVDAHAAFRHWRAVQQGRRGMDQAGTWCQGFGSGYWWCVDMPVNGDPPQPVRAVVVAGANGVTVTPR